MLQAQTVTSGSLNGLYYVAGYWGYYSLNWATEKILLSYIYVL